MSTQQALIDLVDAIGISLDHTKKDGFMGEGLLTMNWGLCKPTCKAKVLASYWSAAQKILFLCIGTVGDLGLIVDYETANGFVQFSIIDRSLLPERGVGVFKAAPTLMRAHDAVPKEAVKITFEGTLGEPYTVLETANI